MRPRIREALRSPGLLVAVLALVAAIAGTAVAGPGATTSKITKKKVIAIADQEINKLAPGLSVAHAGTANSAQNADLLDNLDSTDFLRGNASAGGDLTGSYPNPDLAPNSVTGSEVANPTRSVNLPVGSFLGQSAPLDFNSGADSLADFLFLTNVVVIEADDDDENTPIYTTFTVPQDAVPGGTGSYAVRASKDADTVGAEPQEAIDCRVTVNDVDAGDFGCGGVQIPNAANTSYTMGSSPSLFPGDSVGLALHLLPHDDAIRIHSVEFRYTATQ